MQTKPEIGVEDLRKILILTIRDDVLNRNAGSDVSSLSKRDVKEALFEGYCRNLDYFDIEYDIDEAWEHFRRLVGECALIALSQVTVPVDERDATLKAA